MKSEWRAFLFRGYWEVDLNMLFVFVEGSDDERFFRHYYSDSTVKIVQYAHMSNKDLTAYLNSINAMQESDYIIITDSDGAEIEAKRKKFIEKHPCCEATKVFVSKREIESWYLAGFSQGNAEKYKVKFIYCTDDISKEKFRSMVPKDFNPVSFQVEILKSFDTVLATMRNRSFNIFCTK